ncbi:MAG: hypothetical protein ACRCZO_02930 [Cetobacterium sp.]|uniref:hypothetical protein n=1 Tax=Cetobacterium sp. TaxID=2071632 RepID=UPI0025F27F47|nr:hypothetical protein [uncultured Cetobacterium sp.]
MKVDVKNKDLAFVVSSSKVELFLENSKHSGLKKSLNRIESRLKSIKVKKAK